MDIGDSYRKIMERERKKKMKKRMEDQMKKRMEDQMKKQAEKMAEEANRSNLRLRDRLAR